MAREVRQGWLRLARSAMMAACLFYVSAAAYAQAPPTVSQPQGINLGGTSFFDGITSTEPGWAYLGTLRYGTAGAIKDGKGNDVAAFNSPRINTIILLNQVGYTSDIKIGNAHLGLNAILPVVSLHGSFNQPGATLSGNTTAMGDITIGPVLQFDPILGPEKQPIFFQRFELDAILPTGQYRQNADLNPSSGYYSINPYWAATLFLSKEFEISWRLHYLYNFKNNKPAASYPTAYQGAPVTSTQAGQATWLNFSASYEVMPKVHVGASGYYFKQLTDSKANGIAIPGSREQVLGLGPAVMIDVDQENGKRGAIWFNAYTESMVRNRAANNLILQARFVHVF